MTTFQATLPATDTQLDTLIYALYGLTDAEIAIVDQLSNNGHPPFHGPITTR